MLLWLFFVNAVAVFFFVVIAFVVREVKVPSKVIHTEGCYIMPVLYFLTAIQCSFTLHSGKKY